MKAVYPSAFFHADQYNDFSFSVLAPETTHSVRMESSLSLCTDALEDLSKGKAASCAKPC